MKDIKECGEKVLFSIETLKNDLIDFLAARKASQSSQCFTQTNQKALDYELKNDESKEKDGNA